MERIASEHPEQIRLLGEENRLLREPVRLLLEYGKSVNEFLHQTADAPLKLADGYNKLELAQLGTADKPHGLIGAVDQSARNSMNA